MTMTKEKLLMLLDRMIADKSRLAEALQSEMANTEEPENPWRSEAIVSLIKEVKDAEVRYRKFRFLMESENE